MEKIVIAHISDVHFGDQLFHFPRHRFIHGLYPHDPMLCQGLRNALEDARVLTSLEDKETFEVVLTGDLSQLGSTEDFRTALTYFHKLTHENPTSGGGMRLGLELPRLLMVPGNHDHWDGGSRKPWRRPKAYNRNIFPTWFKQTPWHERLASANGRVTLDLFGVDSNSGLRRARTNLRARGSISAAEFRRLESLLKKHPGREPNNVRVILCHHALSQRWALFSWILSPDSARQLTKMARQYHISVVLTGHTHDFWQTVDASHPQSRPKELVELRSTTTLQYRAKQQGFWVHRVQFDQHNPLEWASWRYQWNGLRFVRTVHKSGPWVRFRI